MAVVMLEMTGRTVVMVMLWSVVVGVEVLVGSLSLGEPQDGSCVCTCSVQAELPVMGYHPSPVTPASNIRHWKPIQCRVGGCLTKMPMATAVE